MTTVALLSHTGYVGSNLLRAFLPAHTDGKIKLVVIHRPSSNVATIPEGIERRILDLDRSSEAEIKAAVDGIEVFISTVGSTALPLQAKLFPALAASKSLRAFIPSDFGTDWTAEDLKTPELDFINVKYDLVKQARDLKIPTTEVKTSLFTDFFFKFKFLGTDVNANTYKKFRKNLTSPLALTDIAHVGQVLFDKINALPPKLIIYTVAPTGQNLIDVLTAIHNRPTEIAEYTESENEALLHSGGPGVIAASLWKKWGNGDWAAEENSENLEAIIRKYL
ncbi:hypothetical protein BCR39DRAFT_546505 [Naematelia encephala]|uniref:NmrA-like domain-containing protein n=1 Tax=Naematelia encephala TaxID=71784 RepID=A0A1Y2AQR9_9TREE|nr:hypothetical protein BCR39DRAFT_546505 [Naematelia encephala]